MNNQSELKFQFEQKYRQSTGTKQSTVSLRRTKFNNQIEQNHQQSIYTEKSTISSEQRHQQSNWRKLSNLKNKD